MAMKDVLVSELNVIRLSDSEVSGLRSVASDLIRKLKENGLEAFIGGSMAKGTMVRRRGRQDIDIFVVFDYSEDVLKLEGVLEKMKLPGDLKKVHGSRDYFHVDCGDVVLEVIPVVKNSDPELAENVTDMSLSHVKYVKGEIERKPDLAGEVMLAKTFCRAQRCYGAEGYGRGFSGYSLEILVIYFGGFVKFLKGVGKKKVIDPHKYFRNKMEVLRELNSSKLQGPLVVVDPTYRYRNVCAGLGLETFEKFLEVASNFLKSPSLEGFVRKDFDVEGLKNFASDEKARFLELGLFSDRQEGDIAGTKMRKILGFFVRELERNGQEVLRVEFDYSGSGHEAKGYLVVVENEIVERKGPSVGLQEQAAKFCGAKKDSFKRKGFWWCRESVSVERVLEFVKKVEREMGAEIGLINIS